MARVVMQLDDGQALTRLYVEQIAKGRLFVPGASGLTERTACEICVELPWGSHVLAAEVVFVRGEEPGLGVGFALAPLDAVAVEALRALARRSYVGQAREEEPDAGGDERDQAAPDGGMGEHKDEAPDEGAGRDAERAAATLQERIRALSAVEQQRLAVSGALQERVALERIFGPSVWEALLRNARLTIPEVARIARKGTLPRPQLDSIAGNPAWVAAPEVQRAILANPRSSPAAVSRALHAMPRSDLARVPQQTAYPAGVRQAAKKMLG